MMTVTPSDLPDAGEADVLGFDCDERPLKAGESIERVDARQTGEQSGPATILGLSERNTPGDAVQTLALSDGGVAYDLHCRKLAGPATKH